MHAYIHTHMEIHTLHAHTYTCTYTHRHIHIYPVEHMLSNYMAIKTTFIYNKQNILNILCKKHTFIYVQVND